MKDSLHYQAGRRLHMQNDVRRFDLNIERVLEHWTVTNAPTR